MTTEPITPGKTRFSFFVESPAGLKAYLEANIDDIPLVEAQDDWDTFLERFAKTATWLAENGFKRDQSFDKPAGGSWGGGGRGGGGGRAEDAVPADLQEHVPEHCGRKTQYKAEWVNRNDRVVPAKFVCRKKGDDCSDPDVSGDGKKYPWEITEKALRARLKIPAQPAQEGAGAPKAAKPAKDKPMGYGDFLNTVLGELGYNRAQLLKFAHTNEEELKALGPAGWAQLLERLRSAPKEEAK